MNLPKITEQEMAKFMQIVAFTYKAQPTSKLNFLNNERNLRFGKFPTKIFLSLPTSHHITSERKIKFTVADRVLLCIIDMRNC